MANTAQKTSFFICSSPAIISHRKRQNRVSNFLLENCSRSALLKACRCFFVSLLLLVLQAHTCRGRRLYGGSSGSSSSNNSSCSNSSIARCSFRTGDSARDEKLTPFYVPVSDKHMYEEGVKEYLSKMGAPAEQLAVVCEEIEGKKDIKCELCLYNEISTDQKHVRQGQVLDSMLLQCMRGKFDQAAAMENSEYHPICYPRPQQRTARKALMRSGTEEVSSAAGEARATELDRRHPPQEQPKNGPRSAP